VGWTKADFRQDQFEKDQEECIQTLDNRLDYQTFAKAVEECLVKKGYNYEVPPESPLAKEDTKITVGNVLLATAQLIVGAVTIIPVGAAYIVHALFEAVTH
jgi:hypothetical protein